MRFSSITSPSISNNLKAGLLASLATMLLAPCAMAQSQSPNDSAIQVIAGANTPLDSGLTIPSTRNNETFVVAGRLGRMLGKAATRAAIGATRSDDDDGDQDGESVNRATPRPNQPSPAPARTASPAPPAASALAPTKVAATPREPGIFDQWSQTKLKNQQQIDSAKPHPLALDHPDDFVVVCEGGCRKGHAQVVYLEPRSARGPVYKTSDENSQSEIAHVACVGGCYKSGVNQPLYYANTTVTTSKTNSWVTTTTPEPTASAQPAPTTGRWYERINGGSETSNQ